jgi:hypothetical protein
LDTWFQFATKTVDFTVIAISGIAVSLIVGRALLHAGRGGHTAARSGRPPGWVRVVIESQAVSVLVVVGAVATGWPLLALILIGAAGVVGIAAIEFVVTRRARRRG